MTVGPLGNFLRFSVSAFVDEKGFVLDSLCRSAVLVKYLLDDDPVLDMGTAARRDGPAN